MRQQNLWNRQGQGPGDQPSAKMEPPKQWLMNIIHNLQLKCTQKDKQIQNLQVKCKFLRTERERKMQRLRDQAKTRSATEKKYKEVRRENIELKEQITEIENTLDAPMSKILDKVRELKPMWVSRKITEKHGIRTE